MSSSNSSQATAPNVTVPVGTTYTFTGTGVNVNTTIGQGLPAGQAIISADEIKMFTGSPSSITNKVSIYSSGDCDPCIAFTEMHNGQLVKALFEPDSSMQASDLARILTLMMVMREANNSYSAVTLKPITYIKKHNLERHFRFSAA